MSQRISLTRVIALNWYGFRQIFEVEDNVLISGAFGTGKSALLDLMQYVLLGEHWRANRAAAGNARGRDLVGYCLGDTNQTRNGHRHFLRQSGVTLAALEFARSAAPGKEAQRETWGIRLEYSSPEAASKQTYFYIPERLDFADVAPDGKLLADDAFRTWIRREYGNECLFARQRDYLEEMAAPRHLNFDAGAFQRTFPKAIAFELEENVEKFIREFVLEESPLDVRDVRSALRAYDETRRRLERQEDEAGYLRRICEQHTIYETSRREAAILAHTEHGLKLAQAEERRDSHAESLKQLEDENADDLKNLERVRGELAEVENFLSDVKLEIQRDPAHVDFDRLHRQKRELQEAVDGLREAQKAARHRLDDRHYRWVQWLKHGTALPLEGLKKLLDLDDALLSRLRSGNDAERIEALPKLSQQFNEIFAGVRDLLRPIDDEIRTASNALQQLAADLENLSKGQAPGAFPLLQAVRQKLGDRVEQLGRLIEVKPDAEEWWPALELYLGRNRWVLVAGDERDYREALDILRKTPPGREPESLLNPGEVQSLKPTTRKGSLFEKVEVAHPIARTYVEHLLGEVMCVPSVDDLERTSAGRAITPEGIYKQTPLRRRLRPATTVELTLGREGLLRMRAAKLREQNEWRARHDALRQRRADVQTWLDIGQKGGLGDPTLPDRAAELPQLPKLEAELGRVRETLQLLMTPEREARQNRYNELETRRTEVLGRRAVLSERHLNFETRAKPIRDNLARAREEAARSRLESEASRVELSKHFSGILDRELAEHRHRLRAEFPSWGDCLDAARVRASEAKERASVAREKRNAERFALANARDGQGNLSHPEYQTEHRTDDESNQPWAARLRDLEEIELTKSRQLAADRKKEWERRLEENILNELNRRITDAQNTIRLLDRYLSLPIGRFRYRITQRRDTAGYGAIWRLLDTGLEPTDPLAAAIQQSEVQQAKDELMKAVDAPEEGGERTRRLLDYRNYHHYDLEMVVAEKPDAAPISFSRSGRNLSGGESQAPFFISMMAAFRRVYDRGDRGSARSQQLGLVVMDEAFSKLSGDGIEDCLALARNFQLQLVMAFPPERLGVMVPHAQTVVMCQKEVELDSEGYFTRITNIPLLTTMADAMEALV